MEHGLQIVFDIFQQKKNKTNVPEVNDFHTDDLFDTFCAFWVLNGPLTSLKHRSEGAVWPSTIYKIYKIYENGTYI